jgi:hypothetical protein
MKKLVMQGLLLFGIAGTALASGAAESGGGGMLVALFFGFVGVVVLFQLVPSLVVFFSLIKEIFAPRQPKATQVVKQDEAK